MPSVVRVLGFYHREDGTVGTRMGSGFFVRGDGCVVTTAGAVEGAHEILLEFGSQSLGAETIGSDPLTNLALLRPLEPPEDPLPFFPLGEGPPPPVTAPLLAITCEVGLDPSPCLGMVCGHHIRYGSHCFPTTHLRSSLPSNAGAPGSPVFDLDGNFVGVLMASIPQTNGSFILPARALRRVLCDLLIGGSVHYAYVGLGTQLGQDERGEYAVRVERVDPDSPAALAQLAVGDRILALNGQPLTSLADLHDAIFFAPPDSPLPIRLRRGSEILQVTVRPGRRPSVSPPIP
jgi:S1-C subfamily serine protease